MLPKKILLYCVGFLTFFLLCFSYGADAKPYTLPVLVETALNRNPAIMEFLKRQDVAMADIKRQEKEFYPLVSMDSAVQYNFHALEQNQIGTHLGITMDTKLLERNRLNDNLTLADLRYRLSTYQTLQQTFQVMLDVHSAYHDYLFYREQYRILQDASEIFLKLLQTTRSLVQENQLASYKLQTARVVYDQSLLDVKKSQQDLRQSLKKLSTLVRSVFSDDVEIEGHLSPEPLVWSEQEMTSLLLKNSPDMLILDIENQIEYIETRVDSVTDIPKLKLFSGYIYEYQDTENIDEDRPHSAIVTAFLDIPFDFTGKSRISRKKVLLTKEAHEFSHQTRETEIEIEALADFHQMQYLWDTIEITNKELDAAKTKLKITRSKFDNARITYLNFEEVVQEVKDIRLKLFTYILEYQKIRAKYSILESLEAKRR